MPAHRPEQLALVGHPTAAARAGQMTEAQLLAAVRKLARLTQWLCYHTHDSRRSEPGFPDVVMVHARRGRVIFAELKDATRKTTPEQDRWLAELAAAGCEVAIWRPDDLPEIATVLRGRWIEPGEFGLAELGPVDRRRWR